MVTSPVRNSTVGRNTPKQTNKTKNEIKSQYYISKSVNTVRSSQHKISMTWNIHQNDLISRLKLYTSNSHFIYFFIQFHFKRFEYIFCQKWAKISIKIIFNCITNYMQWCIIVYKRTQKQSKPQIMRNPTFITLCKIVFKRFQNV